MVVEELALLLLDSDWTLPSLKRLLSRVYRRFPLMAARLAASILTAFPHPPSRKRLTDHLHKWPRLKRGLHWSRVRQVRRQAQLSGSPLRQSVMVQHGWDFPSLATLRDLTECLGMLDSTLAWLSRGPRGLGAAPDHYRIRVLAKRSAGFRLIEAPKAKLKRVQRTILSEILDRLPAHPAAHGFICGRSTLTHVQPHLGRDWILRMDLEDFFPSIDGARIFGLFRSLGYPYEVTQSLTNLTTHVLGLDTIREHVKDRFPGETCERAVGELGRLYFRRHLPQGAPTSPMLANLVAYRFDCRLTGLAQACGASYSRYGDDLLFSGDEVSRRRLIKLADQVAAIALEEGFRIRHRKTAMVPRSQRQTAVGIVINEKPNLVRHEYDQLKAILYNCCRHGPASQNRAEVTNFAGHLRGRIEWLRCLNPDRGQKLMALYHQISW